MGKEEEEKKFITLKKKLEALSYHQPLGIESAPLVEKLLLDLVRTTESFQTLRQQLNKTTQDLAIAQNQVSD